MHNGIVDQSIKEQSANKKGVKIFLFHGSGLDNVGDSAQMYATVERLERLIQNCQVIIPWISNCRRISLLIWSIAFLLTNPRINKF